MIGRVTEKIGVSGVFVCSVVLAYVIMGFIDFESFRSALPMLGKLVVRISPVLLLVFGVMFVTNLFFEGNSIVTFLEKGSGLRGWMVAIAGGIISSGPIYMWYPLLGDLKERGMKDSLIAAFLYNRAIKIPLLPMMVYYFGWHFTLTLSVYMILFSIVNGLLVQRLTQGERVQ